MSRRDSTRFTSSTASSMESAAVKVRVPTKSYMMARSSPKAANLHTKNNIRSGCVQRPLPAKHLQYLHRSNTAACRQCRPHKRLRRRRPSCIVPVQVLALARPCLRRSSIAALRPWQILSRQGVGLGHSLPPVLQRAGRLRLQAAPRLNLQCHPELPAIPLRHRPSRRMSRRNRLNRPTLQCLPPPLQSRLNRPRVLCQAPILPSYPVITHP